MQFETRVISIEEQISCIGRAIDYQKSMSAIFSDADGRDIQADIDADIVTMVAIRSSLRRLAATETAATSVSVPAEPQQLVQISRDRTRRRVTERGVFYEGCWCRHSALVAMVGRDVAVVKPYPGVDEIWAVADGSAIPLKRQHAHSAQ